jgi:prepilin-type N-terminal cleavage/methylation domain-containing protein
MRSRAAFTLIELLVVIAIIAVLAGLISGALLQIRVKVKRDLAIAQIQALANGLASYHADRRRYPRLAPETGTHDAILVDDAPALFEALMDRRQRYLVGWETSYVGLILDRTRLDAATMGQDGVTGARLLEPGERQQLGQLTFRANHDARSTEPLVFMDPFGNPYHYREWDRIAKSVKQAIDATPPQRTGVATESPFGGTPPLPGPISDRVWKTQGYVIWSNGPNGVNEYGDPASDDITSFSR